MSWRIINVCFCLVMAAVFGLTSLWFSLPSYLDTGLPYHTALNANIAAGSGLIAVVWVVAGLLEASFGKYRRG